MSAYTHWKYPRHCAGDRHTRVHRDWRPFYIGPREAEQRRVKKRQQRRQKRYRERRQTRKLMALAA